MYELVQVSENCFYIQSPAKTGIVRTNENTVCLIDSGNDKDAGKRVKRILDAQGWTLKAIYNTHSHADHIGGNRYLQTQTGCQVYAPGIERDFTEHPILEPSFLYGGNAPKVLRHKFLMAQECTALPLTEDSLPAGWEIIPLPGHSFDMVGFRTPDNVVFTADSLSDRETLEKYRIVFLVDVEKHLQTLESLKSMQAACFVPSHANVTENIVPLVQMNIDNVMETAERIAGICRQPVCFERILQRLFDDCCLTMTFDQYVLVGSTVRSYLTWLYDTGRLNVHFEDNVLLWHQSVS